MLEIIEKGIRVESWEANIACAQDGRISNILHLGKTEATGGGLLPIKTDWLLPLLIVRHNTMKDFSLEVRS